MNRNIPVSSVQEISIMDYLQQVKPLLIVHLLHFHGSRQEQRIP